MEFRGWPKIPRLFRDIIVTEKIDGTNGAVIVERHEFGDAETGGVSEGTLAVIPDDGEANPPDSGPSEWWVGAQSRNRIVTPDSDNHGFAKWVEQNAGELALVLGEGRHFGEWWGSGIQRGYGLKNGERRFSLFNTTRFGNEDLSPVPGLGVVPVLANWTFSEWEIREALDKLFVEGSRAEPGFMKPEGIVVFHTASNQCFKVTFDGDLPKTLREEYALAA